MTFSFASQEEADRVHDRIDAECRKLGLTSLRSRAELPDIPEIAALGTDSCGLPLAYANQYCCSLCGTTWTDDWSCEVDDDCPSCGCDCSPERSSLRIPEIYVQLFDLLPEIPW